MYIRRYGFNCGYNELWISYFTLPEWLVSVWFWLTDTVRKFLWFIPVFSCLGVKVRCAFVNASFPTLCPSNCLYWSNSPQVNILFFWHVCLTDEKVRTCRDQSGLKDRCLIHPSSQEPTVVFDRRTNWGTNEPRLVWPQTDDRPSLCFNPLLLNIRDFRFEPWFSDSPCAYAVSRLPRYAEIRVFPVEEDCSFAMFRLSPCTDLLMTAWRHNITSFVKLVSF